MEKVIGFIGSGNMGSAMIGGILGSGLADKEHVLASCKSQATKDRLEETYGISVFLDNQEVAKQADILFLAVKPYMFAEVIDQIKELVKEEAIIVSVAAGQTIAAIEEAFSKEIKLVRAMPNTPAMVGEAMSAICSNGNLSEEEICDVISIFESFGQAEMITEKMMDAVIGVSGSSPAYVYMFIEAMADAAVADGMPRKQAYKFAAQAVLGAAKMVLETGTHPGELKDAVCSPGGTTIEAVAKLEEMGLRTAVIEAQRACVQKSRDMSK